jgi:hypothetical protein
VLAVPQVSQMVSIDHFTESLFKERLMIFENSTKSTANACIISLLVALLDYYIFFVEDSEQLQ